MAEYLVNDEIREHIREIEGGFQKKAYDDARGHSIGYGHYIQKHEEHLLNKEITKEEAEQMLEADIKSHQKPWLHLLKNASPDEIKVLTDYAYNAGPNAPGIKDAIRALNAGDKDGAAKALSGRTVHSYNKTTGRDELNPTLVARREWSARNLKGDKVSWSEVQNEKRSLFDRAKGFFKGSGKCSGSSSSSVEEDLAAMIAVNSTVLIGLKEINATNRSIASEDSWLQRLKAEGRGGMGWAAQ